MQLQLQAWVRVWMQMLAAGVVSSVDVGLGVGAGARMGAGVVVGAGAGAR